MQNKVQGVVGVVGDKVNEVKKVLGDVVGIVQIKVMDVKDGVGNMLN